MSQVSEDEIYYYVEDLLLNHKSSDGQRVKSVKIHGIRPIGTNRFDVEFSVETYTSFDDLFVPSKGTRWLSSHLRVDTTDIKVKRDIKINNILKNLD